MKLTVTIETDNDAFQPDPAPELADILTSFAQRIDKNGINRSDRFPLRDVNGNTVGFAEYE